MSPLMCGATRRLKIRYASEESALRALEDVQQLRRRGRAHPGKSEKRVYQCPTCKDWHLTSQG